MNLERAEIVCVKDKKLKHSQFETYSKNLQVNYQNNLVQINKESKQINNIAIKIHYQIICILNILCSYYANTDK